MEELVLLDANWMLTGCYLDANRILTGLVPILNIYCQNPKVWLSITHFCIELHYNQPEVNKFGNILVWTELVNNTAMSQHYCCKPGHYLITTLSSNHSMTFLKYFFKLKMSNYPQNV